MIGQKNLIKQIDWQIEANCFSRFSIFVGERGSERNEFPTHISKKMNVVNVHGEDVKIETIRSLIENAYKTHDKTIYTIYDADNMSIQAKNALLKITEEPPNNAYFIMTLEDINNALDTIRSRATVYTLEPYSVAEILDYAKTQIGVEKLDGTARNIVADICSTPGDVELLSIYGVVAFYEYVQKVDAHIATVNGANAFKIVDKLALKDEEDKYDLRLFWKAFIRVCSVDKTLKNYEGITITSRVLQKLGIRGINKQMLFDDWLLEVRKAWM